MDRRHFMGLVVNYLPKLSITLGSLSLMACQSRSELNNTPLLSPSFGDWRQLKTALQGDLLFPDASEYVWRAKPANSWFDHITPACILCPKNVADVQLVIKFLQQFSLPFAVRGGGHSYIGASTTAGVLVDMHYFAELNWQEGELQVGAGRTLGDIYRYLGQFEQSIPAGSCASVGVVGLVSGGGLGIADRVHGLTCDALLSVEVVLADGRVLHCDAQQHADFYWAIRGGCAANFGIITSLRFKTFQSAPIRNYIARYKLSDAEFVLQEWQKWSLQLPDSVWTQAAIWVSRDSGDEPEIQIRSCSIGDLVAVTGAWQQLELRLAKLWSNIDVQDHQYLDFMLADCKSLETEMCKLPHQSEQAQLKRVAMAGSCDLFNKPLGKKGISTLVTAMKKMHRQQQSCAVLFTLMGGTIARVAPDATAFAHRDALFSAQYLQIYPAGTSQELCNKALQWTHGMRNLMRPWSSGRSYVNYPDKLMKAPQQSYYGQNYPKLQRVKQQYDPKRFFKPPQGI